MKKPHVEFDIPMTDNSIERFMKSKPGKFEHVLVNTLSQVLNVDIENLRLNLKITEKP